MDFGGGAGGDSVVRFEVVRGKSSVRCLPYIWIPRFPMELDDFVSRLLAVVYMEMISMYKLADTTI